MTTHNERHNKNNKKRESRRVEEGHAATCLHNQITHMARGFFETISTGVCVPLRPTLPLVVVVGEH